MTASKNQTWKLTALDEILGGLVLDVEDKLTIGRGKDNDVVLGSKQVSRQHAELSIVEGKLYVQDLGSSNGTLVNDSKLTANTPIQVTQDDVVSFAVFNFQADLHQQAASPVEASVEAAAVNEEMPAKPAQERITSTESQEEPKAVELLEVIEQSETAVQQPISPELTAPKVEIQEINAENNPIDTQAINEQKQHEVAHVKEADIPAKPSNGGNKGLLWVIIVIVLLAVAFWLSSIGVLA